MPPGIYPLFLLAAAGGKKGRRPCRISFQDSLSLSRERGGGRVTRKHLEKLYKLYIFSVPPVFTHWMDALKECELCYDNPENRKKKERNGHSKSTQEVTAEFGGLDKIQRRQVQVSLWSQ